MLHKAEIQHFCFTIKSKQGQQFLPALQISLFFLDVQPVIADDYVNPLRYFFSCIFQAL